MSHARLVTQVRKSLSRLEPASLPIIRSAIDALVSVDDADVDSALLSDIAARAPMQFDGALRACGVLAEMRRQRATRSQSDARVRRVMAAMDRAAAEPDPDTAVAIAASCIIDAATLEAFHGWSIEACRAVVLAHALHAPDARLVEMAAAADDEVRSMDQYAMQRAYEAKHGYAPRGFIPIDSAWHPDDLLEVAA